MSKQGSISLRPIRRIGRKFWRTTKKFKPSSRKIWKSMWVRFRLMMRSILMRLIGRLIFTLNTHCKKSLQKQHKTSIMICEIIGIPKKKQKYNITMIINKRVTQWLDFENKYVLEVLCSFTLSVLSSMDLLFLSNF